MNVPKLDQHQSSDYVKALLIGDSGTGKTGSLASLARAGYNLYIVDFDNGLDILPHILSGDAVAMARVEFETFTDEMQGKAGRATVKGAPRAFSNALKHMSDWPGKGPLNEWTPQDVLVIDSLTMMAKAAMRFALSVGGRLNDRPQIQDWGYAMDAIEETLALLYSSATKANVVVISHIQYNETEGGQILQGFPSALGNKLPPKIPRYFNTVLLANVRGAGKSAKREILTQGSGIVQGKTPAFGRIPPSLSLETGMADYFKAMKEPKK